MALYLGKHHGGIIICCVWCNIESVTHLKPLHWREQHGCGQPLRIRLILIYCIFIVCLVLVHGPRNKAQLLTLASLTFFTWVVEALLTTRVEGLDMCWLH